MDLQQNLYGEIKPGNRSLILEGTRTDLAVLLLHGFISSPFEVRSLAEELHGKGYTVVMPLLPGFGSTKNAGNKARWEEWVESARSSYSDLSRCYPKVSLAGFSLGGAVAAYLALTDERVQMNLHSLTLLSPATRLKNRFFLDLIFPLGFLFGNTIDISSASHIASKLGNHDLEVPERYPEYYGEALPLKGVRQLKKLGREIHFSEFGKLSFVPVTIVFSDADGTVNTKLSLRRIEETLSGVQRFEIPKSDHVRHQILIADKNARFADIIHYASDAIESLSGQGTKK